MVKDFNKGFNTLKILVVLNSPLLGKALYVYKTIDGEYFIMAVSVPFNPAIHKVYEQNFDKFKTNIQYFVSSGIAIKGDRLEFKDLVDLTEYFPEEYRIDVWNGHSIIFQSMNKSSIIFKVGDNLSNSDGSFIEPTKFSIFNRNTKILEILEIAHDEVTHTSGYYMNPASPCGAYDSYSRTINVSGISHRYVRYDTDFVSSPSGSMFLQLNEANPVIWE